MLSRYIQRDKTSWTDIISYFSWKLYTPYPVLHFKIIYFILLLHTRTFYNTYLVVSNLFIFQIYAYCTFVNLKPKFLPVERADPKFADFIGTYRCLPNKAWSIVYSNLLNKNGFRLLGHTVQVVLYHRYQGMLLDLKKKKLDKIKRTYTEQLNEQG